MKPMASKSSRLDPAKTDEDRIRNHERTETTYRHIASDNTNLLKTTWASPSEAGPRSQSQASSLPASRPSHQQQRDSPTHRPPPSMSQYSSSSSSTSFSTKSASVSPALILSALSPAHDVKHHQTLTRGQGLSDSYTDSGAGFAFTPVPSMVASDTNSPRGFRRMASTTDTETHGYGYRQAHDHVSSSESEPRTSFSPINTPGLFPTMMMTTATTTTMPTHPIPHLYQRMNSAVMSSDSPIPGLGEHATQPPPFLHALNQTNQTGQQVPRSPHHSSSPRHPHNDHHNYNQHTHHTHKTYPPSPSGILAEGGTAISVDMKRLLSKPAPAGKGSATTRSLPGSDSEFSAGPQFRRMKSRSEKGGSSSKHMYAMDDDRTRSQPQLPQLPFQASFEAMSSPSPSLSQVTRTQPSSSVDDRSPASLTRQTSYRRLLKRKPSGPRSPSTPTAASSSSKPTLLTRHAASNLTIDSALSRRTDLPICGGTSTHSSPLTPAGAVAEAYKQQEQKRASSSGGEDVDTPRVGDHQFVSTSEESSRVSSPVPYYTVIGTTSGRLVAVGGPSDRLLDGYSADDRPKHDKTAAVSHGRALSRKLSTRWKKAAGGLRGEITPPSENTSVVSGWSGAYEEMSNVSSTELGTRSASMPRQRAKAGGTDISSPDVSSYGHSVASLQGVSTKTWVSAGTPVDEEGRVRSGKGLKKEPGQGKEEGKIWKLMKRISTGGLRDKYHATDKSAPPVPSLPKDFIHRSVTRGSGDSGDSPGGAFSRFISRSSISTPVKSLSTASPSPSVSTTGHKGANTGRRPSMATGSSSSPVSSDVASSRFFHRTHSTRSSTSSYGEAPPPLPTAGTMLGKHILPPSELYRMNMEHDSDMEFSPYSSSPRRIPRANTMPENDALPPPGHSPEETRPNLPLPPRRAVTTGQQLMYHQNPHHKTQPSPDFPLFSTAGAINTFPLPSPRTDHAERPPPPAQISPLDVDVSPGPPTRPAKSPKRPQLSASISSPPCPTSTPHRSPPLHDADPSRRSHDVRHIRDKSGVRRPELHRKSSEAISTTSTARLGHRSANTISSGRPTTADSGLRSPGNSHSPLKFRELDLSTKTRLTAKQKADIWDDLLERSEKAGGTIRIGGQDLMSERMTMESRLSLLTDLP